jgi:hypothetical protein
MKKFERFTLSLFDLLVFVAIFVLVIINIIA